MASRITRTTRQWLIDALFQLMKHQDYATITVEQIYTTAELSRKTFYRKFKSKDDVLNQAIADWLKDFEAAMQAAAPTDWEAFSSAFFLYWNDYRNQLTVLVQHHLQGMFLADMTACAPALPWLGSQSATRQAFLLAGLAGVLVAWCTSENPTKSLNITVLQAEIAALMA